MVVQKREITDAGIGDHLIRAGNAQWAFWRWAALRGAGFPASEVLRLSAPDSAAAADALLEAEQQTDRAREGALRQITAALDDLRKRGQWDDKKRRGALLDSIRRVKAGKLPPTGELIPGPDAVASIREALTRAEAARIAYRATFKKDERRTSQAAREVARSDRFREAVIWQNRKALHTAIDVLLNTCADTPSRGSKQRQYEELIASYLQRYAVKNDTIGFFGPVGWAKLVPEGQPLACSAGDRLLATRKVYLEWWCIDAISKKIEEDESLRPWMVPLRASYVRVEGTTLYHPKFASARMPVEMALVLDACDGKRTAKEIAEEFKRSPHASLQDETHLFHILKKLQTRGLIYWGFNIPVEAYPERRLRQLLERIEDSALKRAALSGLDHLEAARDMIVSATGDAVALDRALENFEETFIRLTGKPATRAAGETYAARTLIYEDCRRDVDVAIGPELLNALEPALTLLLTSARWFTFELAKVFRRKFKEVYITLVRQTGSLKVDASRFWMQLAPYISGREGDMGGGIIATFQQRWSEILSMQLDCRRMQYTSEELRPKVLSAFDAPRPGWPNACYHCPDIMIAAPSPEAVVRGQYQLVMGELHLGGNTLGTSLFVAQHANPEELFRAVEKDLPGLRAHPIPPKDFPRLASRTNYVLLSRDEFSVEFSPDTFEPDRSKALPISSLVIEACGNELVAGTRDGALNFDIIQILTGFLHLIAVDSFRILSSYPHTPRISIDNLIISRETWRFSHSDLAFAFEKEATNRFLAARRWAREQGIPRFSFVKVPVEVKPFYVDFDSPIYIDLLAKMIRRTRDSGNPDHLVNFTEMLPTPDQVWLPDAEGNRYTSELRIVAVDQAT